MKIVRECVLFILLATVFALLRYALMPNKPVLTWTRPRIAEVELANAMSWRRILWVDGRDIEAFHQQHIPGAIPLNENAWEELVPGFLAAWEPDARVIVYCDSQVCEASQAVALRLDREFSLDEIYVLKGGWSAWLQTHR